MYVGKGSLCLLVSDLERAIRFYGALGMEVVEGIGAVGESALVRRGHSTIFLTTFGEDLLNYRGADAFEVQAYLREQGWELEGRPERYTEEDRGEAGSSWMTRDPDGHGLFFNTHEWETTPEYREESARRILRDTERELEDIGASPECLSAYRELLARFG